MADLGFGVEPVGLVNISVDNTKKFGNNVRVLHRIHN